MSAVLVQICSEASAHADACVRAIADLMGLSVVTYGMAEDILATPGRWNNGGEVDKAFVVSGLTLHGLFACKGDRGREEAKALLNQKSLLVYGFPEGPGSRELLCRLLAFDPQCGIQSVSPGRRIYEFHDVIGDSPLAGCAFESFLENSSSAFCGTESSEGAKRLVSVNGRPLLIHSRKGSCERYLLSETPAINIQTPLVPPQEARDYYSGIMPVAVALRQMFATACWHNPFPSGCVVIDDPLIREQYGFFNYAGMMAELSAQRYAATVAFIPDNYLRSDAAVVEKIRKHADLLSICVHGCEHTESEFGSGEAELMESKATIALDHMRKHATITGLEFDRVMVFPQGVYSSVAMGALKKCAYLAAVNTRPYPTDFGTAPISIRDTFDLAIHRYSCLPLFTRRYPKDPVDFAIDLFWGKPVLVVEHHDYFRHGVGRLTEFVNRIKGLKSGPEWLTLEKALIQAGHYRRTGSRSYDVRFFTDTFRVGNPLQTRCAFTCCKREDEPDRITGVADESGKIAYTSDGSQIRVGVDLEPGEFRTLNVSYKPWNVKPMPVSVAHKCRSFVRRRLSEFRDNHLAKSERTLRLVSSIKAAMFRGKK